MIGSPTPDKRFGAKIRINNKRGRKNYHSEQRHQGVQVSSKTNIDLQTYPEVPSSESNGMYMPVTNMFDEKRKQ